MKHPTLALAVMFALAGGSIATASAQQYGYPNQYGYPQQQQQQQQRRHHRHRRDRDDTQGGYYQQCGNAYGDQNRYGYRNNGYANNGGRYGNNGACQTIRGTITAVNGNQVTLRVGDQGYGNYGAYGNNGRYGTYGNRGRNQITIDDQPALNNQSSGRVAVGRFVTAIGYWSNGVFYATTMN